MTQPEDRDEALKKASTRLVRRREPAGTPSGAVPWSAEFLGLRRVGQFAKAPGATQEAVLAGCAAALLDESWMIERSGIVFCAKMVLLAESSEEKRLFALIGADEATHSAWLEPWITRSGQESDPFNRFITGLVEAGSAQPLAYLLQVVLEGFGIVHYSGLASECRDVALASSLAAMAQDEALHHAAGLAAFRAERLSAAEKSFLSEGAHVFLQMIRSGPQAVVAALDRSAGLGSAADAARVFGELDAEQVGATKLARLRRLMAQPGMEWLVDELDGKGVFVPCTASQCAQIYAGTR